MIGNTLKICFMELLLCSQFTWADVPTLTCTVQAYQTDNRQYAVAAWVEKIEFREHVGLTDYEVKMNFTNEDPTKKRVIISGFGRGQGESPTEISANQIFEGDWNLNQENIKFSYDNDWDLPSIEVRLSRTQSGDYRGKMNVSWDTEEELELKCL